MLEPDVLSLTPVPALNALIWVLVILVAGYLARMPVHRLIRLVFTGARRLLRLLARYCVHAEHHARAWTRSVLLAQAREHARDAADWNLERFGEDLERELKGIPELEQQLRAHLSQLEQDYRTSGAPPPDLPGWPRLVEHLGPDFGGVDPTVKKTLEDLRDGLETQRADLLDAYRRATRRRYLVLHRTMPYWRRVRGAVEELTARVERLRQRADDAIERVNAYEALRDEHRVRIDVLAVHSLWRFSLSVAWLALAGLGFVVLGQLLAEPLNSLLGTASPAESLPGLGTSATILLLGAVGLLGLLLMESSRATRMLPGVSGLDTETRRWLFWSGIGGVLVLIAAFAFLTLYHGGIPPASLDTALGPIMAPGAQAALVILLPCALVFTVLPVRGLVRHGRIAGGYTVAVALQIAMLLCRLLASLAAFVSSLLIQLYDLVIFLPLWIEETVRQRNWRVKPDALVSRGRLPSPTSQESRAAR
ncbi:hypothetical protein [Aquisalimonas asiatica]|uniref:Uncharacterized protein n=1 Tax=Aquisalimonas asiatica TaxID=406100 RepID=A0A1H8QA97_9GAMM|nr:hypothetical protein [Aquisalimonas asiatica]SEO50986.1 hypothetical protein SAMN04488052_101447 [Aquisalimonas asiatica]